MEAQNGSEFAALAARLDELSQVCARLSRENADLRERVTQLTPETGSPGSPGRSESPAGRRAGQAGRTGDGRVSRRMMGKALGAAAAGVVGGLALAEAGASPAAAANGDAIAAGNTTNAESATTVQFDGTSNPGVVFLANDSNFAAGAAAFPAALGGWANNGNVANGIYGYTEINGGSAVVGQIFLATSGSAVLGVANTAGQVGVSGVNADGIAVLGTITSTSASGFSAGVRGVNDCTTSQGIGVYGSQNGSGWGVYGTTPRGIGVYGNSVHGTGVTGNGATGVTAAGTGAGVRASASGPGAVGVLASGSSNAGRGGVFSGAAAQVRLAPGSRSTHPANGKSGDLYADSTGRLWFCKKTGNPATWHQIA
jgi:hypothetical protein